MKEDITLKKTIEWLSRNLYSFEEKQSVMHNYLSLVKQHIKEDYAVIVIDNSILQSLQVLHEFQGQKQKDRKLQNELYTRKIV